MRDRQPSEQTMAVVLALAESPDEWRHGYDLCRQTGLKAGSIYPILIRLADRGWLETTWETEIPSGRPPRHLYRLTRMGLGTANAFASVKARAARTKHSRLRTRIEAAEG